MNRLKICHIIHNTEFGGTETMLYKVVRELSARHDMHVISLMRCGEIGERIRELGVPVHALRCAENRRPRPQRLISLGTTLRSLKPDVVQTWGYHADLVGGVAAKTMTRAAILWNVRHATLDRKLDSRNTLRSARLCARLSRWVPDRILLNAHAAMPVHVAEGYDQSKMMVLPNGFDVEKFQPQPDAGQAIRRALGIPTNAQVVGMCGRFHRHKGQAQFVQAAEQLARKWPRAHFLLAGNRCDESNEELQTWLDEAKLAGRCHLLGSRSDIPQLLNAMDVFVLPSLTEGMPNVVGEAMACGTAVVATDVGDARFLMGEHGTVVPPGDANALAEAIDFTLQQNPHQHDDATTAARQRIINEFEIGVIAKNYETIWQQTLDERQSPGESPVREPAAKRRPRLVHVTTIPMTQWFFLRGQNHFMTEQGFDVYALTSNGPFMQRLKEREPITTHEVPLTRAITPARDLRALFQLWRLFRKLKPEIVQLSTPKAALLGALASAAAGVPIRIYHVRGLSSEGQTGLRATIFRTLERLTGRLCNANLVNAPSLLEYATRTGILRSGYVAGQGTSNGVDLERFDHAKVEAVDFGKWGHVWRDHRETPEVERQNSNMRVHNGLRDTHISASGPVIGFIGRVAHDKGTEDLCIAWQALRADFPEARMLLVGPHELEDGISRNSYETLLDDPRVIMTGMRDDVASYYKGLDIFVYPSHGTEGFPNAPMEAAAMGLPVIATNVVGCVDAVVDGVTGTVVPPRDPRALEVALRTYLANPELRRQHGRAGQDRVRRGFNPPDLWADFCKYYHHLLRREGLPLPVPGTAGQPSVRRAA